MEEHHRMENNRGKAWDSCNSDAFEPQTRSEIGWFVQWLNPVSDCLSILFEDFLKIMMTWYEGVSFKVQYKGNWLNWVHWLQGERHYLHVQCSDSELNNPCYRGKGWGQCSLFHISTILFLMDFHPFSTALNIFGFAWINCLVTSSWRGWYRVWSFYCRSSLIHNC